MKNIFIIILPLLLLLAACNNDKKAAATIREYMRQHSDNYNSYEPVSFSKLDTSFQYYIGTAAQLQLSALTDSFDKESEKYALLLKSDRIPMQEKRQVYQKLQVVQDTIFALVDSSMRAEKNFKPFMRGYYLEHTYRIKNKTGTTELKDEIFILNKTLDSVIVVREPAMQQFLKEKKTL